MSLAELDALLAAFIVGVYNQRPHSQIGEAPHVAWLGKGWLPRLPENHASIRTTQLYNRPAEEATLDEVERNFV